MVEAKPIKIAVVKNHKFTISNRTDLKLDVVALRSYLRLICEFVLYTLPDKKVRTAEDHGKYMKDRPTLVLHLLRNGLLQIDSVSLSYLRDQNFGFKLFLLLCKTNRQSFYLHGNIIM